MKLRTRIFLGMAALSIGVAALTWVLSFFLLEPYYLSRKRAQLERIAEEIGPLPDSTTSLQKKFSALERTTTVHISVVGADGQIEYDSSAPPGANEERLEPFAPLNPERPGVAPRPGEGPTGKRFPPPFRDPPRDPQPEGASAGPNQDLRTATPAGGELIAASGKGLIFERTDPRIGLKLLFLSKKQESGSTLVLSFPVSQATESAQGALLFLTISGVIAILAGAVMSYFLARSATRPFAELIGLTKSIASLDFSRRFSARRGDEVAILGGTMNDLSDSLERALAELEESNARLRADVERERSIESMRKEFISSVSHELKTPIALIIGYAEGVMEGVAEGEEARNSYLSVIVDEARKMDAQVRDLLELSQIDSGVFPLKLELFDMRRVVEDSVSSFALAFKEKDIEPELDLVEATLVGDREMLRRAFVNFLTNALSFVDKSGRISVRLTKEDGRVAVTVFNSGSSVPEESIGRIWDSYYKADASRRRDFGGTGLGLAIVRGIVARHGGGCSAENVEDADGDGESAGVAFSLWVPASGPPAASGERPEAAT